MLGTPMLTLEASPCTPHLRLGSMQGFLSAWELCPQQALTLHAICPRSRQDDCLPRTLL